LNGNGVWVVDVLTLVKQLRHAYREAAGAEMERRVRELLSLLRDEECRIALDQELKGRRWSVTTLDDQNLVVGEAELGEKFGYTRREIKGYIRRVRAAVASGEHPQEIANTKRLAELLEWLHGQVKNSLSEDWPWWSRRRKVHRVCSVAEERLFGVGVLVANTAQRTHFDLSYILAVMTLRENDV
jgi:hypothetical protein